MNPFVGPIYISKGLSLIRRPGLRRFVLIPLLVNIVLFSAAIALGVHYFDALMAQFLPQGWEWLEWLLWPIFAAATLVMLFYTFTLVANFICSPFNSLLAEAVERELTGTAATDQTTMMEMVKGTPATLANEGRKLGYFLLRAVPLLLLFLIPGLNLLAPLFWFLFGAWMLSHEYLDYPMGNHGIQFKQQREIIRGDRFGALGFGATTMVLTMIPVVNFFVMPVAVAGATAFYLERVAGRRGK